MNPDTKPVQIKCKQNTEYWCIRLFVWDKNAYFNIKNYVVPLRRNKLFCFRLLL